MKKIQGFYPSLGHFGFFGHGALHKSFGPKTVLIQDGNHCVAQVTLIVEIDTSVIGGSIALPNRSILSSIIKLNQQRATFKI
jgi:hypothetical protein